MQTDERIQQAAGPGGSRGAPERVLEALRQDEIRLDEEIARQEKRLADPHQRRAAEATLEELRRRRLDVIDTIRRWLPRFERAISKK
jgi:hypothetical protein